MNNFTKWIRRELLAMGTMTDTARKMGTSPQQLCKWYQGRNKPNLVSFKRLCEVIAQHKESIFPVGVREKTTRIRAAKEEA